MGVQKKNVAAKRKPKGQMKSPGPPKAFEMEDFDDDDDDFETDSDDSGEEVTAKKTPQRGTATPMQSKSGKKKDVHVSFQLQDSKTPKGNKVTPKGNQRQAAKGTPVPGKKTPGAMQADASGKKDSLKEFSGMNNNIFGGKIEVLSPPLKGKINVAAAKRAGLLKGNNNSKDDEENEDSDDFEDDMDDSDIQDSDDVDDEDDLDDDLDEEDDDDLEDDDDEDDALDSEEEKELRQQILAIKGKSPKTPKGKLMVHVNLKDSPKASEPGQKTPKVKENSKSSEPKNTPKAKTPNKAAESPAQQKNQKNVAKNEAKQNSPQKKTEIDPAEISLEQKRRRERDAKNLFVKGIPRDVRVDELKALSPDILDVMLPWSQRHKKVQTYFAFLEFASEAKAEENYKLLQSKKLRGAPLMVDFVGEKSKHQPEKKASENTGMAFNRKKLHVSGMSTNTTIAQVAQLFPKACSITMNSAPEFRTAWVFFNTEEDADEAFKAGAGATINGRALSVLHSNDKNARKKSKKRKPRKQAGQPAAKKSKMAPQAKNEDSDDDDDDDDDDEE